MGERPSSAGAVMVVDASLWDIVYFAAVLGNMALLAVLWRMVT